MGETVFNRGADQSDALANGRGQFLEFYHLVSGKSVRFKAFLNKFSDKYASAWNDEEVHGRMDAISTFKGTKREITVSWTVVAGGEEEAVENLEKCSLLFSMLYPSYDENRGGATTINGAPLFKCKFMNLIQDVNNPGGNAQVGGLLGKVTGFEYTPELEEGFFDSLNNARNNIGQSIYPQTIKLDCQFTVMHQHPLGWASGKARGQQFNRFPYADSLTPFESSGKVASADTESTINDTISKFNSSLILIPGFFERIA